MSDDADLGNAEGDTDLRRRAAWLLAMLVVVAALIVLLMTVFLNSAGHGSSNNAGPGVDDPTSTGTHHNTAKRSRSSAVDSSPAADSGSASSGPSGGVSSAATSAVPTPSCPGTSTCAVTGDVGGTQNAINAYRSKNGAKSLPTATSAAAKACAVSSGNDCSGSYVWVHVTNLTGQAVVQAVLGYGSSNDLLDDSAKSFDVAWAYDPGAHSTYCALIADS